jgi:hypothetical protein
MPNRGYVVIPIECKRLVKVDFPSAVVPAHPAPEKSIRFINGISVQPVVS